MPNLSSLPLQAIRQELLAHWQRRPARERKLITGALALLALVVVWYASIAPAISVLNNFEPRYAKQQKEWQDMLLWQSQAQKLQGSATLTRSVMVDNLRLITKDKLGSTAQISQQDSLVFVTLSGCDPVAMGQWLSALREQAHVSPSEAQLTLGELGVQGKLQIRLPSAN